VRSRLGHRDQVIVYDPRRTYVAQRMIELANELTETAEVAFAFPNFVSEFKRTAAPTPRAEQWHLRVVEARKAWATTLGKGVTVAVLDDGVDVDHPNLKGNIRRNPDPGEPRDLCGRDFFVGEDAAEHFNPRPKLFRAPFGQMAGNDIHGTCCAGVAMAAPAPGRGPKVPISKPPSKRRAAAAAARAARFLSPPATTMPASSHIRRIHHMPSRSEPPPTRRSARPIPTLVPKYRSWRPRAGAPPAYSRPT
jgi:subtilisin family serine protease